MHKSRLATLVIDCMQDASKEVPFWSRALGIRADPDDKVTQRYFHFLDKSAGLHVIVQDMKRKEDAAFHVDIETDDVEAEVKRLEALGATRKKKVSGWWVMQSPSGHTFCVIPTQFDDFPEGANTWNE